MCRGCKLCVVAGGGGSRAERYVGRPLGALSQLQHGVRGRAFAVDARTIFLQDFHYDGEGPGQYSTRDSMSTRIK